eukprot:14084028-Ditylum_brightwellii.AAC.1
MLLNSTNASSIDPTLKPTKTSTPDPSKIFIKLTNKDKTKAHMLLCIVITPQTNKAYSNQADIKDNTTEKPPIIPNKYHKSTSKESHLLISMTTDTAVKNDTNSETAVSYTHLTLPTN